jgi:hypothetical protein
MSGAIFLREDISTTTFSDGLGKSEGFVIAILITFTRGVADKEITPTKTSAVTKTRRITYRTALPF